MRAITDNLLIFLMYGFREQKLRSSSLKMALASEVMFHMERVQIDCIAQTNMKPPECMYSIGIGRPLARNRWEIFRAFVKEGTFGGLARAG